MKTKGIAFTMLVVLSMSCFAGESGNRFGFELNGGASFATRKMDWNSLNPGFGFEGTLHYRIMPYAGVYGGWGWNRFAADHVQGGEDLCFEETGYVLGLYFNHPIGISRSSFYIRSGALYNHIETENADGDIISDTGHGYGFQLAGGISVDLGKNWSLTPGLKFNTLPQDTNYQYISVRIGIAKNF